MSWAGRLLRRAVRSRPGRAAIGIVGVAVSALLVLVLLAGYRSVEAGVRAYTGQPGADLWVAPKGTDNLVRSSALLPAYVVPQIAAIDGVADADPVLRGFVSAQAGDRRLNLLAMGYRGPSGLGGPPRIVDGRPPRGLEEVALDRAAAWRLGVGVGDEVALNERPLRIVGLTGGTNLLATSFAFIDGSEAERAGGATGRVSFVIVRIEPGASASDLADAIEAKVGGAVVWTREEWVENNVREVTAGFRPLQVLVSLVGIVSATVLVALLAQGAVDERRRDIAVLLALGAPASGVARGVVIEAARIAVAGVLAGGALSLALRAVVERVTPTVELAPSPWDLAGVLATFGAATVIAAAVPMWRLARIDPVEAFRP